MRKYFSAILVLMLLVGTAGCYDDEFKSDSASDDMSHALIACLNNKAIKKPQ